MLTSSCLFRVLLLGAADSGVQALELSGLLPCLFYQSTGWYCPGCGGQRAFQALLQGRVAEALGHNALLLLVLVLLPLGGVLAWRHWRARPVFSWWWAAPLLVVVLLFGVLRNVPLAPWDWLAP